MRAPWSLTRFFALALTAAFVAPVAFGANPIEIENAKPGTPNWSAIPEAQGEIEGYASAASVNRGETISFYVNTEESTYMIEIFRVGWYGGVGARRMLGPVGRTGTRQTIPTPDPDTGLIECNWTDPYTITIPNTADPTDWASGAYLARLTAGTTGKKKFIFFIVRDDARKAAHYFQSSITTAAAYENWGGKSLYSFNSCYDWRDDCTERRSEAVAVSLNRPFNGGAGTGIFLYRWEYNMVRFLEREGYDVTYGTNIDTARRGSLLLNHKSFLSVGHDEYWSWEMRQNVEAARNAGVHLGFFSANSAYWQIRFEPSTTGTPDRTIVGYKNHYQDDPFYTDSNPANDHLVTNKWRLAPVNRPESALLGVQYYYDEEDLAVDMVIDNVTSAPWVFAGTGATTGTRILGILGYEIDAMDANSPAGTIRLAHSPYLNKKVTPNVTQYSNMTVYTHSSGAVVFATGTIQWTWAIDDWNISRHPNTPLSPVAQQITRNILYRFAPDCRWSIDPTAATVGAAAGTGTINVTSATPSCSWSPVSAASWLTVSSGATGTGRGTLTYAFTGNAGTTREATLTIGDKTFTLTQTACTFSLSKTAQSFSAVAGSDTINVTTQSGCSWTASSNQPWATITSGSGGTGSGTVAYNVSANSAGARNATLTIAGQAVAITQADGTPIPGNFSATALSTTSIRLSWTAVNGATGYEIMRAVDSPTMQTITSVATLTYTDSVTAGRAYVYKVRAVLPTGFGPFTTPDIATTITFLNDPLTAGRTIREEYVEELRDAVNMVRKTAGLTAQVFTDPTLVPRLSIIRRAHVEELRTALAPALGVFGISAPAYTDPTLTTSTPVKAVHFQQLRNAVK